MNCICITAYKAPEMLSELLNAVENDFLCYVHIDRKNRQQFKDVIERHPKVKFFSAFKVSWGGISIFRQYFFS